MIAGVVIFLVLFRKLSDAPLQDDNCVIELIARQDSVDVIDIFKIQRLTVPLLVAVPNLLREVRQGIPAGVIVGDVVVRDVGHLFSFLEREVPLPTHK